VQIRPVREEEHEPLGRLTIAAYERLERPPSPEYARLLADVAARTRAAEVLVAVDDDGRLLGGVTYVSDPASPYAEFEAPDEACFRMLAVDPSAQGAGVGAALVEAALELARRDGKRAMTLYTTDRMRAAQRLYHRFGFRREPGRDIIVESGLMLRSFVLPLDPPGGGDADRQ
jgi:GNAT superfamily N-acetyltransferase